MPLPLIIPAMIGLGYGIKKGIDAKEDFDEAEEYNELAQDIYNKAQKKLEKKREKTNTTLEDLGRLKVTLYDGSLADFVDIFSEIKNIDFEDKNITDNILKDIGKQDILDIKDTVLKMEEVLGGGIAALGGGALAGFGALGGVGMFATASTGTAISTLGGAAATNATLAWLGGGSLAAGGFGMAGGMAVLGGIVAGPVLAVGGAMMASKAEEAKYKAYENFDKAKVASAEMDSACVVLDGIYKRGIEFINILEVLQNDLDDYIDKLENIVEYSTDYRSYTDKDKQVVMITASIAKSVKNICDAPIIDSNGKVTRKSRRVLNKAKELNTKLNDIKI